MAAALVDHARSLAIEPKPEHVVKFENFPGEGIHGKVDGNDIYIGNKKIALRAGCATGEIFYPENYIRKHLSFTLVL
jgi:Cd2+/Zn2+-exporting ATPase